MPKIAVLICGQIHDQSIPINKIKQLAEYFFDKGLKFTSGVELSSKEIIKNEQSFIDLYDEDLKLRSKQSLSTTERSRKREVEDALMKTILGQAALKQGIPKDQVLSVLRDEEQGNIRFRLTNRESTYAVHSFIRYTEDNGMTFLELENPVYHDELQSKLGQEQRTRPAGLAVEKINERRDLILLEYEQPRTDYMTQKIADGILKMSENGIVLIANLGITHVRRVQAKIDTLTKEDPRFADYEIVTKSLMFKPEIDRGGQFERAIRYYDVNCGDSETIKIFYQKNPCPVITINEANPESSDLKEFYNVVNILDSHISTPILVEVPFELNPKQQEIISSIGGEISEKEGKKFLSVGHHKLVKDIRDQLDLDKKLITIADGPNSGEQLKILRSGEFFATTSTFNPRQFFVTFPKKELGIVSMFTTDFESYKKSTSPTFAVSKASGAAMVEPEQKQH